MARDPYPSLSVTTPSFPEKSPLEPPSKHQRRLKKFRKDNAKWAGQKRAIERLDVKPKKIEIPQIPK